MHLVNAEHARLRQRGTGRQRRWTTPALIDTRDTACQRAPLAQSGANGSRRTGHWETFSARTHLKVARSFETLQNLIRIHVHAKVHRAPPTSNAQQVPCAGCPPPTWLCVVPAGLASGWDGRSLHGTRAGTVACPRSEARKMRHANCATASGSRAERPAALAKSATSHRPPAHGVLADLCSGNHCGGRSSERPDAPWDQGTHRVRRLLAVHLAPSRTRATHRGVPAPPSCGAARNPPSIERGSSRAGERMWAPPSFPGAGRARTATPQRHAAAGSRTCAGHHRGPRSPAPAPSCLDSRTRSV